MRNRALFITLLTALVAVTLAPLAPAGEAPPPETQGDAFRAIRAYSDGIYHGVDFHPDGERALIAGGTRLDEYQPDRYLLSYDGDEYTVVHQHTSHKGPFMDVAWRPQGDYAIVVGYENSVVRCNAPCLDSRDHFQELPLPGRFNGFNVAWHPSGDHALVTGSSLLRWNGTALQVVSPGVEAYFNAVAWHPSGDYALVQMGPPPNQVYKCDAPCGPGAVLTPVADYGKFGSGTPSIEDITFHPDGTRAYVVGQDATHGLVLELGLNGEDPMDWSKRYIDPKKRGEITSMRFHPTEGWALLTSSLERQAMRFDAETGNFTDALDASSSLKLNSAAWHPNGTYAVLPTRGGFIRYDPLGVPVTNITTPTAGAAVEGVVNVTGTAFPNLDAGAVDAVEYRVGTWKAVGPDRTAVFWGDWRAANHTGDVNRSAWWFHWDTDAVTPGDHALSVRAWDGGVPGTGATITVSVANATPPTLNKTTDSAGGATIALNWTPVTGATGYVVEESRDQYFLEATVAYNGTATSVTLNRSEAGTYHFRVGVPGSDGTVRYWSNAVSHTVEATEAPNEGGDDPADGGDAPPDGSDGAINTSIQDPNGDGNTTHPDGGQGDPSGGGDVGMGDKNGTDEDPDTRGNDPDAGNGNDTDPKGGDKATATGITRLVPGPGAAAALIAGLAALWTRRPGVRKR